MILSKYQKAVQGSAKVGAPGLVNSITAVAYHFCTSLPTAFTQPGASTLADLSTFTSPIMFVMTQIFDQHRFVNVHATCRVLETLL